MNRIEKWFIASDRGDGKGSHYGSFKTSGAAERAAEQIGWGWIGVITDTYHGDTLINTSSRYYQLPGTEQVTMMNADEKKFFDRYEGQVQEGQKNVADLATKAAGWTTDARMSAHLKRGR